MRRNFLIPFQLVWDFPQPATTMGKRSRSNVPAQALALMNDPFVVQEAERWVERWLYNDTGTLRHAGRGEALRPTLRAMVREALGRRPLEAELDAFEVFLTEHARRDRETWRQVWTDLCHAIFQLKEFVHVP